MKKSVEDLVEEIEYGPRHTEGFAAMLIPIVAAMWSLFQLSLANLLLLDSVTVRCIHLAFAMFLTFLSYPAFKKKKLTGFFSFLSEKNKIPYHDMVLASLAALAALYLWLDFEGIGQRQGIPLWRDIAVGVFLLVALLEAARRALGPALPIIATVFIVSSLFASSLPGFLASRDVAVSHLVSKLTLSTEGIYGSPLRISADVVFLFVLFGAMLEKAGGGHYFVQLAFSLLGGYRGGPAKAAVLASGLTGMVSGSSIANTVTTGTFTIPLMKKCGYPAEKAGAVEVAASTNGQLMPPIMGAAAFIIAEYCNMEYFEVVRAAFVPALLSYITLIYITHLEALKLGIKPVPKSDLPAFFPTLFKGLHFTLPVLLLLYELIILRHSAARAAYVAILVLAGVIIIRNAIVAIMNKEGLWASAKQSARLIGESLAAGGRNMMAIGVAVAAAGIIVGVVSMGLGGKVTEIIDVLSGGHLVPMLIITAMVSLILGMGLPTTANYIIMANLTAPTIILLADQAGLVVPLIAAHLFCFYFGILADDTPPVGLAAYAASAIAKSDPIKTGIQGFYYDMRTAILPFMFIFNTDLLLIGVQTWWHALGIFATGLVAMFAFAAVTQNYFLIKNRFYESALLILASLVLLRPDFLVQHNFLNEKIYAYCIGIGIYCLVLLSQKVRIRKKAT